jgi:hypothetical protein
MILQREESVLFFKLYINLLLFVNSKLQIYKNINTIDAFEKLGPKRQTVIRDQLYENISLLEEFYKENPAQLTELELGHVLKWKRFTKDRFLFYKQYKKHCAVLYDKESVVLAVLGLTQSFDQLLPYFPIYSETVLLPFKDKIVSDGYLETSSIYFGGNIKRAMKNDYDISKNKFGIIQKLPIIKVSDIDVKANLLKYYINNAHKSPEYDYNIQDILTEEPSLEKLCHQELGEKYSKHIIKKLKTLGFDRHWFACLDDIILASGQNEQELKENIEKIAPDGIKDFIYIFKL